tara:strand:+ start:879 stop:1079 length:201 start_codon:yes stop_codon:yes gene_type:complete
MNNGVVTTFDIFTEYDDYMKFSFSDGICARKQNIVELPIEEIKVSKEKLNIIENKAFNYLKDKVLA